MCLRQLNRHRLRIFSGPLCAFRDEKGRVPPLPGAKCRRPLLGLRRGEKCPAASSQKVKVGLTIDEGLIDAVDDYIYLARKQGRRLKKNDVYEAALRQFLKAEGVDIR